MSPRPEPRIGDVERDAAIRALGEHYAAGRLTKEEFDERSDVAVRARTDSELRPLFLDLPPLYAGPAPVPPGPARVQVPWGPAYQGARRQHPRGPRWQSLPLLPLLVLLVVVAVLSGAWWLLFVGWLLFACRPRRPGRPY
jgi:anti-sigma-K factor RskA